MPTNHPQETTLSADEKFIRNAVDLILSSVPIIVVPSRDENKLIRLFRIVAERLSEVEKKSNNSNVSYLTWDCNYGLYNMTTNVPAEVPKNSVILKNVIQAMLSDNKSDYPYESTITVLFGAHEFINGHLDHQVRRMLAAGSRRNMFYKKVTSRDGTIEKIYFRTLIIVNNDLKISPEISDCYYVLEYDLPDKKELTDMINVHRRRLPQEKVDIDDDAVNKIAHSLKGLPIGRAEDALALSVRKNKRMDINVLPIIQNMKSSILTSTNRALSAIPYDKLAKMPNVVGFDNLINYLSMRSLAYTLKAESFNLVPPKGVVVAGIPGTGKSSLAAAVAMKLKVQVIRYNISALYTSAVGASEEMAREAHRIITKSDGSVIHVDEADKLFAAAADGKNDGGVGQRIFSEFLNYLSEKDDHNIVIMTLNRFDGIPDELFRKGRFDDVYYTDFPTREQRQDIISLHMSDQGLNIEDLPESGIEDLLEETDHFVGAELRQIIIDSKAMRFQESGGEDASPSADLLIHVARTMKPYTQWSIHGGEPPGMDRIRKRAKPVG